MNFRQTQPNFSRGELAPQLYGRFDVDTYQSAVKTARNVLVLKYGGMTKRPGTRLVGEVLDYSEANRIIPFEFSLEQTYAIELGQGYLAPCALGGRVLEEDLEITAITAATNAQVTAVYHGYSAGNYVWVTGIEGAMGDLLNNRMWTVVSVIDADNFTINADTTGLTFTSATGGTARTSAPDPDPTPPTVPDPVTPTPPPSVGGGGGGSFCVADDTLILMADGSHWMAADLGVNDMVRTRHEHTMEWGDYPVTRIEFAYERVFLCVIEGMTIRATAPHPFWVDGEWVLASAIGKPDGMARVAKIEVAEAHTYVSNGILSHNKTEYAVID